MQKLENLGQQMFDTLIGAYCLISLVININFYY